MAVSSKKKLINTKPQKEKWRCFHCKEELDESKFYKSRSNVFYIMPICKECTKKMYIQMVKEYDSVHRAIFRLCGLLDVYYDKNLVDSIIDKAVEKEWGEEQILPEYIRFVNSATQYRGLNFYNSDENRGSVEDVPLVTVEKENMEVWGGGYSAEDYKRLNQLYKKWSDGVPLDDVISISYIRDLCRVELSIEKSVISNGKPTESLLKQKSSIIKDMGLDPATLKKNKEASEGNKTFGKWIDDIEQNMPAEFFSDRNLYKDHQGFEKYFNLHIVRPIKNLLLGHRDFPHINYNEDEIDGSFENDMEISYDKFEGE